MRITTSTIQVYYLSALVAVNYLLPPVPGRIINTDVLIKSCINATFVENDSCLTVRCDNTIEVIHAKKILNAFTVNVTIDINTHKT